MKVVILCGGKGERMGGMSYVLPKPLMPVGDDPVLWHIMNIYSHYGFNEFILCLGYMGDKIRQYFSKTRHNWKIEFVDTGLDAKKSERLMKIKDLIDTDDFLLSYGDDLCDVDINDVVETHKKLGKIATLTAVRLTSPFGLIEINDNGSITSFAEKPVIDHWINGGYMVLNKKIFDYLPFGELENEVFEKLVEAGEICAFKHNGKWKDMTTLKDNMELNNLWKSGNAFWKKWNDWHG